MKTQNKKAFTLVELIVVITILIILGTIAFISLEGYSKNSRDGVRVADVNSARKSLELFITEKGTYPIPDNGINIMYSGAVAWIQGTIGDGVTRNLDKIDKKIVDPLTENEYTYSITASKTEYQIGAITEGGTIGYKLPINQTHAATEKKATAMVRGTYNERFLRVQSGALNWILAIPSIIATDLTQTNVQTILTNNKLVYNNYQNIPHSYNNAGYTMTGGFNYTNTNPLIYSGSLKSLTESNTSKLDFITKLKVAYDGTILHGEANYQDIVNTDLSNQTGSIYLVNRFINTNLGGIKVSNIILPTTGGVSTYIDPNKLGLGVIDFYKINGKTDARVDGSNLIIGNSDSMYESVPIPMVATDLITGDFSLSFNSSTFLLGDGFLGFRLINQSYTGTLAEYASYIHSGNNWMLARKFYSSYAYTGKSGSGIVFEITRIGNSVTACVSGFCSTPYTASGDVKIGLYYYCWSGTTCYIREKTISNIVFTN